MEAYNAIVEGDCFSAYSMGVGEIEAPLEVSRSGRGSSSHFSLAELQFPPYSARGQ